jgi:hypothetical protein
MLQRSEFRPWANNCRPTIRTIRHYVLSVHGKSMLVVSDLAAVHHAGGDFRPLATAFNPITLAVEQHTDRAF